MLRVKYSHQRATEMYRQGQKPADVARMLVEEGAPEAKAPGLAQQYYRSFLLYHLDEQRGLSKAAELYKLIGGVLLFIGLAASFLTYLLLDDVYLLFYGAILGGVGSLIKGFTAKSRAEANVERLTEKHRLSELATTVAP